MDAEEIRAATVAKLDELGITFKAQHIALIDKRESVSNELPWKCDQWRIEFARASNPRILRWFVTDFYTGMGWRKSGKFGQNIPVAPTPADVLHSLCLDAQAGRMSFSDWCDELGYSNDSIHAFGVYQACERVGREMLNFFGPALRDIAEIVKEL